MDLRKLEEIVGDIKNLWKSLLAGTVLLFKLLFTQSFKGKPIPQFPGASVFSGHRSMMGAASSEGEFVQHLNPEKYPLGYFRVAFLKVLLLCDLKVWKEVFMTHGMASSGRIGGYILHMDSHFKHAIVFSTGRDWKPSIENSLAKLACELDEKQKYLFTNPDSSTRTPKNLQKISEFIFSREFLNEN